MPDSLRRRILRLAAKDAELRPWLIQILKESGGLSYEEERVVKKATGGLLGETPEEGGLITSPLSPLPGAGGGTGQPIVIQQIVNQGPGGAVPIAPQIVNQGPGVAVPIAPQIPSGGGSLSPNKSPLGIPENEKGPAPVSSLFVPERAQHGFNSELVPEMNKLLSAGMSKEQVARDMLSLIQSSFAKKDTLYNILIRYQSSFESNKEYLDNIERLIEAWATSTDGA